MTANHKHDNPILVTGAAGAVGGIGRNLTEFLLAREHKVRALVRREDERAEALRRLGAAISAVDVARAVAVILDDPAPHIGQIYDLTGPESADLDQAHPISRRPTPGMERRPSAGEVSRAPR
jgi:uncharacterized protein YbjT (DUF2867 family)